MKPQCRLLTTKLVTAFKKYTGDRLTYDFMFRQMIATAMLRAGKMTHDRASLSNGCMVFSMNDECYVHAFERFIDKVSVTELLEGQVFMLP